MRAETTEHSETGTLNFINLTVTQIINTQLDFILHSTYSPGMKVIIALNDDASQEPSRLDVIINILLSLYITAIFQPGKHIYFL